jgi:hypothetical protein
VEAGTAIVGWANCPPTIEFRPASGLTTRGGSDIVCSVLTLTVPAGVSV